MTKETLRYFSDTILETNTCTEVRFILVSYSEALCHKSISLWPHHSNTL